MIFLELMLLVLFAMSFIVFPKTFKYLVVAPVIGAYVGLFCFFESTLIGEVSFSMRWAGLSVLFGVVFVEMIAFFME